MQGSEGNALTSENLPTTISLPGISHGDEHEYNAQSGGDNLVGITIYVGEKCCIG